MWRAIIAPNGRRDTKHGRGQPGRAPCLGGAARRSAAEPGAALSNQYSNYLKGEPCPGLLGEVHFFCLMQTSTRRTPGGRGA
jgi:hypothetical protein